MYVSPRLRSQEATLERAVFLTGWSELSWSIRAQSFLAGTTADKIWRDRNILYRPYSLLFCVYKHLIAEG